MNAIQQHDGVEEYHDNSNESLAEQCRDAEIMQSLQKLEKEIKHQNVTTKNAIKLSVIVAVVCFFFVALNFSILFTLAGGIAGGDRKLNTLQQENERLEKLIRDLQQNKDDKKE